MREYRAVEGDTLFRLQGTITKPVDLSGASLEMEAQTPAGGTVTWPATLTGSMWAATAGGGTPLVRGVYWLRLKLTRGGGVVREGRWTRLEVVP